MRYYRNGVLKWEGIITGRHYIVDDLTPMLEVSAKGWLWVLSKRKRDFEYLDMTGKDMVTQALADVNATWPTTIRMGNSDVDSFLGTFDREEYSISFLEFLQTFDPLGFQYQIVRDATGLRLDFMQSIGSLKVDQYGNPTYRLFNGKGGNINGWDQDQDSEPSVDLGSLRPGGAELSSSQA